MNARGDAPAASSGDGAAAHVPVMLAEVLAALEVADGGTYVDATYGDGGFTRGILESADCTVIALDCDPEAAARARREAARWNRRLVVVEGRFGTMGALLPAHGFPAGTIGGVAMDLGISSLQLGDPVRGFSFAGDGPLDMRMRPEGTTAADVVNDIEEGELARLLRRLGGERHARRIAAAVAEARAKSPITRTRQLADLVAGVVPRERRNAPGAVAIHPATRTFQALRIHVNDEIGELRRGLAAAEDVLAPDGRLAVISFHSLEDREVKQFLTRRSDRAPRASRHAPPLPGGGRAPSFRLVRRNALRPGAAEVAANPRARSARLRWAIRTDAPAWGPGDAA